MEAKFIETSRFGRWVLRPLAICCFFGFALVWLLIATEGDLASPGRLVGLGVAGFLLAGAKIARSCQMRRLVLGIDGMTRPMLAAYWLSYAIIICVLCSVTCYLDT